MEAKADKTVADWPFIWQDRRDVSAEEDYY